MVVELAVVQALVVFLLDGQELLQARQLQLVQVEQQLLVPIMATEVE